MKFKQQEEEQKSNTFLDSVIDLIVVIEQFAYALVCISNREQSNSVKEACSHCEMQLCYHQTSLKKLAISLNPEHKEPTFTVEYSPVDSVSDLKKFEEKYYNMLKEIGKNALEQNNAEVFSYLSPIISGFKHYFCTLDESNDSGETSS